jgi:hypothetical protein
MMIITCLHRCNNTSCVNVQQDPQVSLSCEKAAFITEQQNSDYVSLLCNNTTAFNTVQKTHRVPKRQSAVFDQS